MVEIEAGTWFEHYYLIALLGEGGMSEVYLAYDLVEARLVAVKFLLGLHADNPKAVARMRREGEIYQTLNHPSVVKVHSIGSAKGIPIYLVLELLRGRPVDEVQEDRGAPLPVPMAVRVLEDCASALNTAHRAHVVHRDVKPQNVILGPDGRATLVDFGIARADDAHVDTQSGQNVIGTLLYAAPEQRRGEGADPRSDQWALGATVYEAVTGRSVVPRGTYQEMVEASAADLPRPSELNPAVPFALDDVCARLLADAPEERYPQLRDLLIELGLKRVELPEEDRTAMFGDERERLLDEATKAFRERDFARARELVKELMKDVPEERRAEIHHLEGLVEAEGGSQAGALRSFQVAREYDDFSEEIVIDLALQLLRMGQIERAGTTLARLPSYIRGHLVVRGIMDLIQNLPAVPRSVVERLPRSGPAEPFHRAVASQS